MIVRNSEQSDFKRCRLKWDYRWNRGLQRKVTDRKLAEGTLMHAFLDVYYDSGFEDAYDTLLYQIEQENLQESQAEVEELLLGVAQHYHEYWSEKQQKKWEVIATEQTYYINVQTLEVRTEVPEDEKGLWYECTLDLVIRINGKLWAVDHKFVKSMEYYAKATSRDDQISRYIFALHCAYPNEEIGGMVYNLIKKEIPKPPAVLKKGGLSKARDQRTTYKLYLDKLKEIGAVKQPGDGEVNPETWRLLPDGSGLVDPDYVEILQLLLQREHPYGNDYFQRIVVKRSDEAINTSMNEFVNVAREMHLVRKYQQQQGTFNPIYRNFTKDCSWDCPYLEVCEAAFDGGDVEYLEKELLEPINGEGDEE